MQARDQIELNFLDGPSRTPDGLGVKDRGCLPAARSPLVLTQTTSSSWSLLAATPSIALVLLTPRHRTCMSWTLPFRTAIPAKVILARPCVREEGWKLSLSDADYLIAQALLDLMSGIQLLLRRCSVCGSSQSTGRVSRTRSGIIHNIPIPSCISDMLCVQRYR